MKERYNKIMMFLVTCFLVQFVYAQDCVDDDTAVAPFTCEVAVTNFGCDFVWGAAPISDSCPIACQVAECECPNNDAGVAPFTCESAVANFGCDFVWGAAPISESCPGTCGEYGPTDCAGIVMVLQ